MATPPMTPRSARPTGPAVREATPAQIAAEKAGENPAEIAALYGATTPAPAPVSGSLPAGAIPTRVEGVYYVPESSQSPVQSQPQGSPLGSIFGGIGQIFNGALDITGGVIGGALGAVNNTAEIAIQRDINGSGNIGFDLNGMLRQMNGTQGVQVAQGEAVAPINTPSSGDTWIGNTRIREDNGRA